MIIYKKNRIVGWINIILGLLLCVSWLISVSCANIEHKYYLCFTSKQNSLIGFFLILMALPLVFTFIINLIYIFRNWKNKKSMILNILAVVIIILLIVLLFIFESYKCVYIVSILIILGILMLIFNKYEEEGKKHRILFGMMIINIVLYVISSIGFICIKNDFKIVYANNEKNLIKNILQESNGLETNRPIRVKKNEKWGCINSSGETIIGFDYDNYSYFIEIENIDTNKKYYIAVVSIGNEFKIITNNNKQIASYKNIKQEKISDYGIFNFNELRSKLKDDAKALNINVEINDLRVENYQVSGKEIKYNRDFAYNSGNILWFDILNSEGRTFRLIYNTKTYSVTYNEREISTEGTLYINSSKDRSYIDTYKNGYIPIYNFEKEIFGWIDLKGQTYYINGKKQILDFDDKYIAIKDYSIDTDAKVYIMNYNGEIVSDYYKEITFLDKGFVVKKQNGKNVYLDDNFRQITKEYDIIDTCRVNDEILIVSNLKTIAGNVYNTYDLDNISFDLININNGKVIGKSFEYIDGIFKYSTNGFFYDMTYNEIKEILCSVDCDYLNTKLYEKYYK